MTRVLIVEDDLAIRNVITMALTDEGYQVDVAAEGQDALTRIDRCHPDVILLDLRMPGMDGWEFVKQYRARHDHRAPILVLTAAYGPAWRKDDVNVESYLTKPFDLNTLFERVSSLAAGAASGYC